MERKKLVLFSIKLFDKLLSNVLYIYSKKKKNKLYEVVYLLQSPTRTDNHRVQLRTVNVLRVLMRYIYIYRCRIIGGRNLPTFILKIPVFAPT